MQNFYKILEKNKTLDKKAIYDECGSVSYEELHMQCNKFSANLLEKGISVGDRIGILLPNSIEFAVIFFSCLRTGSIAVPINPKFRKNEIEYYLCNSTPKLIFTTEPLKKYLTGIKYAENCEIISAIGGKSEYLISGNMYDDDHPVVDVPGLTAIYLYSTGSTGVPKRVSRTHENLLSLAKNHSDTLGWNDSEKILFTLPISHTYALGNFIASIKSAMTIYLLEDFNRKKVVETVKKHKITIYPAVPFILNVLAESKIDKEVFSSLKMIISAGAALSRDTFTKFSDKFGIYPRQLYGSSETGVISINLDKDIVSSAESVGTTVNEVIVKIVKENDEEASVNELGEIIVRSPSMTSGYDNLPEETEKVFKNGYYYTGDLGYTDKKGNIYIVGRKKLYINVHGNKVDPVEIENLLNRHPKISESAVTGFTDVSGNESVLCYLVSGSEISSAEIINYLKGMVADYKIPKSIIFTDSIPRSPTGKILRKTLAHIHETRKSKNT